MLNENAKKWVTALRSSKYKQGKGQLKRDLSYCCLGVACDLYAQEFPEFDVYPREVAGSILYNGEVNFLPTVVMNWLLLRTKNGEYGPPEPGREHSLTWDNDNWAGFAEIADIIESEPLGLFVRKER